MLLPKKKSKLYTSEHVEIGKQSPLKQEWKSFLKSSSLFVRTRFKNSVPTSFGTLVKKDNKINSNLNHFSHLKCG